MDALMKRLVLALFLAALVTPIFGNVSHGFSLISSAYAQDDDQGGDNDDQGDDNDDQ